MVQEAPREVSNYSPSSVCLTVMHTDKPALRPSLCHRGSLGSGPLQSLAWFLPAFMATQSDKAFLMSAKKTGQIKFFKKALQQYTKEATLVSDL